MFQCCHRDLRRREKQLKDEVAIIENKFKMASKSSADVSSQLHEKVKFGGWASWGNE